MIKCVQCKDELNEDLSDWCSCGAVITDLGNVIARVQDWCRLDEEWDPNLSDKL